MYGKSKRMTYNIMYMLSYGNLEGLATVDMHPHLKIM